MTCNFNITSKGDLFAMISLQSHNQVLYYLTQLTLAVNPKSSPLPVKIKRQNDSVSKGIDEISKKSLVEGNKTNIQPSLVKLNVYDPSTMCRMKKSNTWIILNQFSLMSCNKCLDKNYRWKVSYISGANFTKNKQSFPCTPLTGPITLPPVYFSSQQHNRTLCTHCIKNLFNYHVQTRSFKTQRNIKMEHERNPTIMSRLKRCLGQSSGSNMNSGFGKDPKSINMEKLKYLFNNSDLPVEEQKRLKLAFVEGYETGVHRQISKRFARWKQVLSLLSGTVLLILILSVGFNAGSLYRFSLSRHAEINPETIQVNFNDVKGVEEAKRELSDVVEFLKNPKKFSALGGKLPKGVLLVGPPGTGKTLLARAVAGEAGVPFFHASGPEFDEILVGQGARRVRDLFKIAKEKAPAVIFIDEIDSVGATRTNSVLHPYANQTINQLLSEMDGFFKNEGVIVLGATNRREDLDKALMRPGRFDVEIYVNKPDYQGRKEILGLYLSKVPTRDVDIEQLTRCTSGFTGADIQNMVNLAALKAARDEECYIGMVHLEYARDKVIMGPEGTAKTNEDVNRVTAYHEAGHALVASYTKDAVPIYKVTIIPRGPSLGHTSFLRETDVDHLTKSELLANIDTMMGGRVAEELIFGPDKVTTGASSDFEKATAIAEQMVKLYGMSEKVGFRTFISSKKREYNANEYAPSTNELIDSEVKRVLEEAYDRAKAILKVHAKELTLLADALLKYETLNAEDVKAIIDGRKTRFET